MITTAPESNPVEEQATKLRRQIQQWLESVRRIEDRVQQTKDLARLGAVEGVLRSAWETIEHVMEQEETKQEKVYPAMPAGEPEEITLPPNLRPPGEGEKIKSREGSIRLPDPACFPKE